MVSRSGRVRDRTDPAQDRLERRGPVLLRAEEQADEVTGSIGHGGDLQGQGSRCDGGSDRIGTRPEVVAAEIGAETVYAPDVCWSRVASRAPATHLVDTSGEHKYRPARHR